MEAAVLPQKHSMQTGQHMHASQQLGSSMWGAVCKLTGEAWREGELQNGKQTAERKSSRALNGSSLSMGHVKCRVKCQVRQCGAYKTCLHGRACGANGRNQPPGKRQSMDSSKNKIIRGKASTLCYTRRMVQLPSSVQVFRVACHTFSQPLSHCLPSPKPRCATISAMLRAGGRSGWGVVSS